MYFSQSHKVVVRAIFLVSMMLVFQVASFCCSCASLPPCFAYGHSDTVFIGRVLNGSYGKIDNSDESNKAGSWECEVLEAFRGVTKSIVTVNARWNGMCPSGPLEIGKTYVFYLSQNSQQELYIPICSRTNQLASLTPAMYLRVPDYFEMDDFNNPNDDLRFLRGLKKGSGVTVYGRLRIGSSLDWELHPQNYDLQNQNFLITAAGKTIETKTDAKGNFVVEGLPAGASTIEAKLPPGYALASGKLKEEIYSDDCGCDTVFFNFRPVGQLRGKLKDITGKPLAGVPVMLIPAEWQKKKIEDGTLAGYGGGQTDKNGEFEIVDIDIGKYLLGISLDRPKPRSPFNRVFYPNTSQASSAQAISINKGDNLVGYNFTLKQEFQTPTIEGKVI